MTLLFIVALLSLLGVLYITLDFRKNHEKEIEIEPEPEFDAEFFEIAGATELAVMLRNRGTKMLINGKPEVIYTDGTLTETLEELVCKKQK